MSFDCQQLFDHLQHFADATELSISESSSFDDEDYELIISGNQIGMFERYTFPKLVQMEVRNQYFAFIGRYFSNLKEFKFINPELN
jgi:hypothetical protein